MTFLSRLLDKLIPQAPESDRLPVSLTADEASTLYLAARLMAVQAEGRRAEEADQVRELIARILPHSIRAETETLGEVLTALRPLYPLGLDDPRLLALQQAITARRVVRVAYMGYQQDEPTDRDIEPYALHYNAGTWYLTGYCRLAEEKRTFRVSRMVSITPLAQTYNVNFTSQPLSLPKIARVRFDAEVLMQVREQQHPGFRREEPALGQTSRVMIYEVTAYDELIPWLLSWGASAEVIEPLDFRSTLRQEAARMAKRLA